MRPYFRLSFLIVFAAACGDAKDPGDPLPVDPGPPCARALDGVSREVDLFRLEDPAGTIIVHLERKWVDSGVGHSSIYELKNFSIHHDGACRSEGATLDYENSHHNWQDLARATIDGVNYSVAFEFDYMNGTGWHLYLNANEVNGDEAVIARTELFVRGGPIACWQCPGFVPVWIIEVMPQNAESWVELWNPSAEAVALSGWELVLGDTTTATTTVHTFAPGTSIARHALMVVDAPFAIPASGATLWLRAPNGETVGPRSFTAPSSSQSLDLLYEERRYVPNTPTKGVLSSNQPT